MPIREAQFSTAIPTNNNAQAIKTSPGRLVSILVTATGTGGPVNLYDNASASSGTVIGIVPANAAVGTVYALNAPAASGIYCGPGASGSPAFTVFWS